MEIFSQPTERDLWNRAIVIAAGLVAESVVFKKRPEKLELMELTITDSGSDHRKLRAVAARIGNAQGHGMDVGKFIDETMKAAEELLARNLDLLVAIGDALLGKISSNGDNVYLSEDELDAIWATQCVT